MQNSGLLPIRVHAFLQRALVGLTLFCLFIGRTHAQTDSTLTPEASLRPPSIPDLMKQVRPSMVQILQRGRDGDGESVGTGFMVDSEGLIVTCLHVIGEGRPIEVRSATGETLTVTGIHAFDKNADLALLRVEPSDPRNGFPSLSLHEDPDVEVGTEVLAVGNPMGLVNSIVHGVLSGKRDLEGQQVLQIAMPIEPGNSGGPLLDRDGRVLGIVQAKSLLTRNLGFAIPVERLLPMLQQPNSVPMDRWMNLGRLPPDLWTLQGGANWHSRGGRILVDGLGTGFGGRSLLWRTAADQPPADPFEASQETDSADSWELEVHVRIENSDGAAGLIFRGDDRGHHYGFYPTAGQLRLTAFEGSDVLNWRILETRDVAAYRPDAWNRLRVVSTPNGFRCYVNNTPVFESTDNAIQGTRAGLAKFRNTRAEFRQFYQGPPRPNEDPLPASIRLALGWTGDITPALADTERAWMKEHPRRSRNALHQRAHELEQTAAMFRSLAEQIHRETVRESLADLLKKESELAALLNAALLVAYHDQPDIEPEGCLEVFEGLMNELESQVELESDPLERLHALRRFFKDSGFHGSRFEYQHRSNSHVNAVLDDREGIPITLSIVFIQLAQRLGLTDVHGLSLPGHFLVRYKPSSGPVLLIDPFHGADLIPADEADRIGSIAAGVPVRSEFLNAATHREIIQRLVTNLLRFTEDSDGPKGALPYADLLVAIAADPTQEARQRIERSRLRWRLGDFEGIREDLGWVLDNKPPGVDLDRVSRAWESLPGQ